jgi:Rieske Fe-S protein
MPSRRSVVNWLLGTSGGAMAAAILYPIIRYLVPPDVPEAPTTRVVAAREGELKPGEARIFAFGSRPAIVVRTPDGDYRAFSATCTHLNCTVQYRPDLRGLWCACHNGQYDLNGKNVAGPPPRPLDDYAVHVAGGDVVVSKG